jgi:UDP:flavonoid glycosyltransferase YjiC (YdhE family)
MRIEPAPVPVSEIAARARILCNSGQHGMLCLGLAAGIPQVCLPQHLEQLYMARQAEARGVARVIWPQAAPAEAIRAALLAAWDDSAARAAAQQLARELAPGFVRDDAPVLRAAIARWL